MNITIGIKFRPSLDILCGKSFPCHWITSLTTPDLRDTRLVHWQYFYTDTKPTRKQVRKFLKEFKREVMIHYEPYEPTSNHETNIIKLIS